MHSFFDLLDTGSDQVTNLARHLSASLSQKPDVGSHDTKPSSLLSGTQRFNRSIQDKNVGLERYIVDNTNDFRNATATVVYPRHNLHNFRNRNSAGFLQSR